MGSLRLLLLLLPQGCMAGAQLVGIMSPGSEASRMAYADNDGLFLFSSDAAFGFGFKPAQDPISFVLVIIHRDTSTVIWTANRGAPVTSSDNLVFDTEGSLALQSGGQVVWSPETGQKSVSSVHLENSGNLVLIGSDGSIVWQSFRHPTDTLVSNQDFTQGMKLLSEPDVGRGNLAYFLEINSGDLKLYAGYITPQVYWSLARDSRKLINKDGGQISSAKIEANSWKFYDQNKKVLSHFVFSSDPNSTNSISVITLGKDGFITFRDLGGGAYKAASLVKIPSDLCSTPEPCNPYEACSSDKCHCPSGLVSQSCQTGISSPCEAANSPPQLIYAGDGLSYFAVGFIQPSSKTTLNGCKSSCATNCSCLALLYDNSSGSCYLFDRVGSFLSDDTSRYSAYVKVSMIGNGAVQSNRRNNHEAHVILFVVTAALLLIVLMCCGRKLWHFIREKKELHPSSETSEKDGFRSETSEEDGFWGSLLLKQVQFRYKDLREATNNFSMKLGEGGFGSVYQGSLQDGAKIAVKKLEGRQPRKDEFKAEVSIGGIIHHAHLVRLRGYCTEGSHRLLVYDLMANGSLEKWIFTQGLCLDWETRFKVALGTAKGLAYLHEECPDKIVHRDIKPANVLLDEHFEAKVSDFGLARLMPREQSHVSATPRGTPGYVAPEVMQNSEISEKNDVYSFGILLLEIIAGRKNNDWRHSREPLHSYAFNMMEQGKLENIVDCRLTLDPHDEKVPNVIKVALWCAQSDPSRRPSMSEVVQMLQGLTPVPPLPTPLSGSSSNYS